MLGFFYSSLILGIVSSSIFETLELLIVPFITLIYVITIRDKSKYFTLFLVIYSISDIINIIDQDELYELIYFTCNTLYIISYVFLLLEILKSISFKDILKTFPIHVGVLLLLNFYIIFVMTTIINPIDFETEHLSYVRVIEHLYNFVLLSLLSMSFLNYLFHESHKALLLFCGCLLITFSEFLLIGYYYLSEEMEILGLISTLFNVFAFVLFYYQSKTNSINQSSNRFA
jgi:hypothetical protein